MAHHFRRSHVKTKIRKIKPKKPFFLKLWFWLILLLIFLAGIAYFCVFFEGLQIKNILISGNERLETNEILDVAFKSAKTDIINFWNFKLDSDSIILASKHKIEKQLGDNFACIKDVKIEKKFPQTMLIQIDERKPAGVFCGDNECYLVDNSGVIFEEIKNVPEGMIIVRQSGVEYFTTGSYAVKEDIMIFLGKVQKSLKDNFQIDLVDALISNPIRLNLKTGENWEIYFDIENFSDMDYQISKLNLLIGNISPEARKNLHYIDLRFKDRAYYK